MTMFVYSIAVFSPRYDAAILHTQFLSWRNWFRFVDTVFDITGKIFFVQVMGAVVKRVSRRLSLNFSDSREVTAAEAEGVNRGNMVE